MNQVSPFIKKLYIILENEYRIGAVKWGVTGRTVALVGTTEEVELVISGHFKNIKYSSFVRQLNIYGFSKLPDAQEWMHPNFQRGRTDLLGHIRRKRKPVERAAAAHRRLCEIARDEEPTATDTLRGLVEHLEEEVKSKDRIISEKNHLIDDLYKCRADLMTEIARLRDEAGALRVIMTEWAEKNVPKDLKFGDEE